MRVLIKFKEEKKLIERNKPFSEIIFNSMHQQKIFFSNGYIHFNQLLPHMHIIGFSWNSIRLFQTEPNLEAKTVSYAYF